MSALDRLLGTLRAWRALRGGHWERALGDADASGARPSTWTRRVRCYQFDGATSWRCDVLTCEEHG